MKIWIERFNGALYLHLTEPMKKDRCGWKGKDAPFSAGRIEEEFSDLQEGELQEFTAGERYVFE